VQSTHGQQPTTRSEPLQVGARCGLIIPLLLVNRLRWLFRVFWPPVDKCACRSSDNVVQVADWALGWFQALLNIPFYSWQFRIAKWLNKGEPWKYFNYIYGLEWALTIVILFLAAPDASGGRRDLIVLVALWRAFELLAWYIKLLFDKGHRVFLEVERNLLFLIADTVVLVTALALLLEAGDDGAVSAKWSDGFSAFTLNGTPDRYNSPLATLVGVLGAVGGLALLAAGLGIVINLIGARIEEALGEGRPYTGPTRPPLPWRRRV
jgi:hypothetical protein